MDVDGDALTYELITLPEHGSLEGVLPLLRYVPEADFFGDDGFAYRVTDALGASSEGQVFVEIRPVNDPPQVEEVIFTLNEDTQEVFTVSAVDVEGESLTLDWLEPLGRGSATLEGLTIAYAPLKDFFGDEAASLVVRDASGGQTVFSILFRVLPVNDSPSAHLPGGS